jgi:hypothetical protein
VWASWCAYFLEAHPSDCEKRGADAGMCVGGESMFDPLRSGQAVRRKPTRNVMQPVPAAATGSARPAALPSRAAASPARSRPGPPWEAE